MSHKRYAALYLIQEGSVDDIALASTLPLPDEDNNVYQNQMDLKDNVFVIIGIKCSSNVFIVLLGLSFSRHHDFGVFSFLLGSLPLKLNFFLSFHQLETCEIYR
jgi:hypothetical protein